MSDLGCCGLEHHSRANVGNLLHSYMSSFSVMSLGKRRVFWGADEEISDGGSPRVIVYGYDGLPIQPVALPSPDYIPDSEEPHTPPVPQDEDEREPMFIQPHDPDYVPEPIYPEYIPLEDEHEFPVEEQPLPPVDSPTAESPGYIDESDPEEDPEEYKDDETEDGPVDYPMDGGEDGYDDDGGSHGDDADDEEKDEEDEDEEEEEEEHLASADSAIVVVSLKILSRTGSSFNPKQNPSPKLRVDLWLILVVQQDQIRVSFEALGFKYEVGESSTARPTGGRGIDYGYGIRDTWVDPAEAAPEISPMTLGEAELLALREQQRRAREPRPDVRAPNHQDASRDADSHIYSHEDNRRNVQTACPCFYVDFMKCQPLNFKGTEGVVGLTRWIEKMELVFNISGCAIENQVKFATCTLLGVALTWWNGQIRSLGPNAYSMTREVKGNDVPTYTKRFQELTLICTKFVANETEKVDKYINGLPDNIYGNVKSSRPKTLDETIELANDLMDQKLRTYAERQTDNKRKADNSSRNNHGHQQRPFKRQNVAKVYNIGSGEKKPYGGSLPKGSGNANVANAQKDNRAVPKGNGCFECGAPGHFKRDCPKLKNKDGGNGNVQGWVYAVGNAEKKENASRDPDSNVVTGSRVHGERMLDLFSTDIRQEGGGQSQGKQLTDSYQSIKIFRSVSRECRVFPARTSGIPDRLDSRSRTVRSCTVSTSTSENGRNLFGTN
ncbi:putative reverse transcriptase domain-containing protein [Tanacetum coccineum]